MKKIEIVLILLCSVLTSFSQSKTQVGLYTEGGLFFPKKIMDTAPSFKNGIAAGGGAYVSTVLWKKLSASIGVGYLYKFNKQNGITSLNYWGYVPSGNSPYGGFGGYGAYGYGTYSDLGVDYNYEPITKWYSFPQNYIVVPFKLKYYVEKIVFLESGMEVSRMLNRDQFEDETGFNWLVGIGCSWHRFQIAVDYIQGFKNQDIWENPANFGTSEVFRNRMFVLNVSYPLWQSK